MIGAAARRCALPVAVALAATIAFFHRAVLGGGVFVARDILRVYYPLRQYWASRVSRGEFPDWFPYDGLGQPFPGMVISGAFHPSNLLYLVFPLGTAMTVNELACFPVAFLGVYCFARRYEIDPVSAAFGAVLFSFSGYLVCLTNNLLYLMAAATFPWALWASDRFFDEPSVPRATAAACLLALVLLCGDAQSFLVASTLSLVIAAAHQRRGRLRKEIAAAAGLLALTALVGAVQILPAMQVAAQGKPASQSLEAAEAWSMHPLRLVELALGPLFASESGDIVGASIDRELLQTQRNNLWVNSLHVGIPALVFAALGMAVYRRSRRTWLLVGCVLAITILALGKHAGLYAVVFRLVPPWRVFRYPEKLVPYVVFGLALGAAAGLHAVQSDERLRRRAAAALGAASLFSVALILLERGLGSFSRDLVTYLWPGVPDRDALARLSLAFMHRALETGVAAFAVFLVLSEVRRVDVRGALVVVVVFLHLLFANGGFYEVEPAAVLARPHALVAAIQAEHGPPQLGRHRVYRLKGGYGTDYDRDPELASLSERARYARSVVIALDPVTPALWGLEEANRYLPGTSERFADLSRDDGEFASRYAAIFGVDNLSVSKEGAEELEGRRHEVVAEHQALWLRLLKNDTARPRAYLARPRCVASRREAYALVSSPGTVPDGQAVVECLRPLPAASEATPAGEASIVAYAPERVEIRTSAPSHALLVLNDAFYEGWTARVDGRAEPILPANYAARGVPLGPGVHTVVFSYRTPRLMLGALLSTGSLCVALVGCVVTIRLRYGRDVPGTPRGP